MRNPTLPLADVDWNRLEQLLEAIRPGRARSLAEVDGYLCALICGPNSENTLELLRNLAGAESTEDLPIYSVEAEVREAVSLLTRHWNSIAATLMAEKPYFPHFDVDDEGRPAGKEWAGGFIRGMNRDPFKWDRFVLDKDKGAAISLLALLVAEGNPDLVPGGIGPIIPPEKRVELLAGIVACLTQFFRHYHSASRVR